MTRQPADGLEGPARLCEPARPDPLQGGECNLPKAKLTPFRNFESAMQSRQRPRSACYEIPPSNSIPAASQPSRVKRITASCERLGILAESARGMGIQVRFMSIRNDPMSAANIRKDSLFVGCHISLKTSIRLNLR